MHNRLAVRYDITSYSEMITEILCPAILKAVQYCKQISGSAKKGTICSVSGNGTPIVFRP